MKMKQSIQSGSRRYDENADRKMLQELREMLEQEVQKPCSERNYELIRELTAAITDETVPESEFEAEVQEGIRLSVSKHPVHPVRKYLKAVTAACIGVILLAGANLWAIRATGSNLFRLVYAVFTDRFEVQFPDNAPSSAVQPQTDDPYGIRAACEGHGFSPLIPGYIPDGFEQEHLEYGGTETRPVISTVFCRGSSKISLHYTYLPDQTDFSNWQFGIPSDEQNISELEINGTIIAVSKEEAQYTALFLADQTLYDLFTQDLDESESERILRSMFE